MNASVIVPVYNASKTVGELLDALNAQDYKGEFEAILVDDHSSDNSREIIRGYQAREDLRYRLKLIEIQHAGPAIARNNGVQNASAEIIIFTDSDCVPEKNMITELMNCFQNKEVGGAAGTYATKNKNSLIARYIGYDIEFRHSQYQDEIDFAGTYCVAYRKEVFLEANGFSNEYKEANAEDNELSYRVIDNGHKIKFCPSAIVKHPHPNTFPKFFKQQISRATWRVKLFQRNRKHAADIYTKKWTIIQPFIWTAIPLYFLLFVTFRFLYFEQNQLDLNFLLTWSGFIFLLSVMLFLLLLINSKLIFWIKAKKKESITQIIAMCGLILSRSLAWFFGGVKGFYLFILRKDPPLIIGAQFDSPITDGLGIRLTNAKKRVLIVSPHPDDMELFLGHVVQYLMLNGFQIYELLMSWGEMGIRRYVKAPIPSEQKLKKGIQTARYCENMNSKKVYNQFITNLNQNHPVFPIQIIPLHFSDGKIRNSAHNREQLKKILRKINPHLIFAPDYHYPIDFHHDHIVGGRLIQDTCISLKKENQQPNDIYFYQTTRPNFNRFPMCSWSVWTQALKCHRTQFSRFTIQLMLLLSFAYYLVFGQTRIPLRRISLNINESTPRKKIPWSTLIFSYILKFTSKPPIKSTTL